MGKKQKLLSLAISISLSFAIFSPAFADTATSAQATATSTPASSTSTPATLSLQAPAIPPIIADIAQAKNLLNNITLNHVLAPVYKNIKNKKTGKTSKTLSSYTLTSKDVALAVLDPASGNVLTTIGKMSGTTMTFSDPVINVQLAKFNGVNSRFTVNRPAGGTVLAIKYLISNPDSGSKAAIEKGLYPAVYVPYSDNLDTPDVIAYGQNYLNGVINTVAQQLYGLPSSAIPGETITQAVPPPMIKALVYAEHSDTASILNGNVENSLDQMNILLALNGPDTYKYSVSNDGYSSRGIAQFVKSTYESLVQRHPETFLNPDYVAGMQDHVNSIKAMYLLLDDYAGDVRINASQGFVSSRVFDYGAASYNGGTTRVAKAVNAFGDAWNQDRSGQIAALSAQISNYKYQISNLKTKIKKTADKKTKTSLQTQLAAAQDNLSSGNSQLATMQAASS